MKVQFSQLDGKILVTPAFDRLDMTVAGEFRKRCLEAARAAKSLVIDLSGVRLIDSAGLGALASTLAALGVDGRVILVAPHKSMRLLLEVTRLDEVFPVYESLGRVPA